jgi:threonine aldolase
MSKSIDLRSDTVTKPTHEMRQAMANAVVGDDVYGEDPTIQELEQRVSEIFKKDSALFFPSGTMCNLTAILTWCSQRGSEIIVGDQSHIFLFEQAGASQFGGVSPRTVHNLSDGTLDLEEVKLAIRENDIHEPITKLICIENTHNACGGKILPLSFIQDLKKIALKLDIPIHLDGARIWNAITGSGIDPSKISNHVDSLSICLSKGLGAPVGSLLVGTNVFINKARRIRKALGGGMRQSGILAAAGLQAIDDFENGILIKDHLRSAQIAKTVESLSAFELYSKVETNILFIRILRYHPSWVSDKISCEVSKLFKEKRILVSAWSPSLIRIVFHRDIQEEDFQYINQSIQEISDDLLRVSSI